MEWPDQSTDTAPASTKADERATKTVGARRRAC